MKPISRRKFVADTLKVSAITAVGTSMILTSSEANADAGVLTTSGLLFSQITLPYAYSALEPSIDALTMEIHYSKHHAAYVKNVNDVIAAENISFGTEQEFFSNASKLSAKARNNGGGVWNHNFFWQVMKPGSMAPIGKVGDAINGAFGSFDKFKEQFTQAAMTRFGSGWAWLVMDIQVTR